MKKIIPTYGEALVCIQNEVNDPFVVVVGAMDGRMFDPIYPYVSKYHWKGLFVEPLPDLFEKLKKVYPHASELSFANVALDCQPGTRTMYRIAPGYLVSEEMPEWAIGISSFYPDRNRLKSSIFEGKREEIKVQCQTWTQVLGEHHVEKIDVLQIDTEGHDWELLSCFDFDQYRPFLLRIEAHNLKPGEVHHANAMLNKYQYVTIIESGDMVAFSQACLRWMGFS